MKFQYNIKSQLDKSLRQTKIELLTKVQYFIKSQLDESSEVDENSVVDLSSIKLVDESSVLVENTGLKLEELDEKAVVYQSVFSRMEMIKNMV